MSSAKPATTGTSTSGNPGPAAAAAGPEWIEPGQGIFGEGPFTYKIEYGVFRYSSFENLRGTFDFPEQAVEYAEAHGYHLAFRKVPVPTEWEVI